LHDTDPLLAEFGGAQLIVSKLFNEIANLLSLKPSTIVHVARRRLIHGLGFRSGGDLLKPRTASQSVLFPAPPVGEHHLQVEGRFYPLWLRFRKGPIWLRLKAYIHPEDVPPHPY